VGPSLTGRCEEEKKLAMPGIEPWAVQTAAMPRKLSQLLGVQLTFQNLLLILDTRQRDGLKYAYICCFLGNSVIPCRITLLQMLLVLQTGPSFKGPKRFFTRLTTADRRYISGVG
jgi:hypothetical protein